MAPRLFWLLVLALALAVWFVNGNLTHFTYWGWLSFILYICLQLVFGQRAVAGRSLFFVSVATIIVFGVLAMAALNEPDSLLARTVDDYGLGLYFLGTYLVHYMPLAVIVATMHDDDMTFSLRSASLISGAAGLFGLYLLHQSPDEIYGVDVHTSLAAGASTLFVFVAVLWLWSGRV